MGWWVGLLVLLLTVPVHADITNPQARWLFNEGSGTTVGDTSGNGHNGVATGATFITTGCQEGNACLSFDGNDYTTHDNDNLYNLVNAASIAFWVKTTNTHAQRIFVTMTSGQSSRICLETGGDAAFADANDGKPLGRYRNVGGSSVIIKGPTAISDGAWHHLVFTLGATNRVRLYVDKVLVASATDMDVTQTFSFGANPLGLGTFLPNLTQSYTGVLDAGYVYTRELTQTDVDELYAAGQPPVAVAGRRRIIRY